MQINFPAASKFIRTQIKLHIPVDLTHALPDLTRWSWEMKASTFLLSMDHMTVSKVPLAMR